MERIWISWICTNSPNLNWQTLHNYVTDMGSVWVVGKLKVCSYVCSEGRFAKFKPCQTFPLYGMHILSVVCNYIIHLRLYLKEKIKNNIVIQTFQQQYLNTYSRVRYMQLWNEHYTDMHGQKVINIQRTQEINTRRQTQLLRGKLAYIQSCSLEKNT